MSPAKSSVRLVALAAMVALSNVAISTPAAAKEEKAVHCYGVNTCKGTSDCKTAKNDCRAQNDCKGHGFKEMTAKACAAAGGSLTAPAN